MPERILFSYKYRQLHNDVKRSQWLTFLSDQFTLFLALVCHSGRVFGARYIRTWPEERESAGDVRVEVVLVGCTAGWYSGSCHTLD